MKKNEKPWERKKSTKRRGINTRNLRDKILIVCEGEKTEPNYFKEFPVNKEIIELDVFGKGHNTISLVKKTIEFKEKAAFEKKPYVQVWSVFDKDSFKDSQFNNAIKLADDHKIRVAYSNEAFELWYILHFNYFNTGITRKQYCKQLDKFLGRKYEKNQSDIYNHLSNLQIVAIKNAKKLLSNFSNCEPYSKRNPSTTVFRLVEELNKYIER